VWYDGESQIFGSAAKEIALTTPLPKGQTIENRHIAFITHHPDTDEIVVHPLPDDEIKQAVIKDIKKAQE
jgi:hypothetical protein